MQAYFAHLRAEGDTSGWSGPMLSLEDFNTLVGLDEYQRQDAALL